MLIRHGRTALNAERRFCGGRSDPPLDARGREQVAALRERFGGELDGLFCSPQRRALETAAVLGPATVVETLRELDHGALEGREIQPTLAEHADFFRAWQRDPTKVAVPGGGESMGALATRVDAGIRSILDQLPGPCSRGQVIAVVGHQLAWAAFVCRALGRPLRDWPQFELRNASANLLAFDGARWSLLGRKL
ncbi:Phosphoserine phosphatase 1 [Enhygromyxa salina]|uniref:Phosphoserine phosphatase 1 n=1 Tax=Enhygromyxa salina TaxID=215803 RepID=A0A2S9XCE2_9BACT|nr:histidine phosphatase family protein [Enhygromyxa salina]PRP90470.1 Phosphoserine phosphatase 1 [Enhygromyxa salina]